MSNIPTCAVQSIIRDSVGGEPLANATVQARLSSYEIYEGFVVPQDVTTQTDAEGAMVLNLFPNELGVAESFYEIKIIAPNGKTLRTTAVVPNLPTVELSEIAGLPPYPGQLNVSMAAMNAALNATNGFRDEAVAAATTATTAAETAAQDSTNATQARIDAQAARDQAVPAAATATTQAAISVTKAGEAAASAAAAASAEDITVAARNDALAAAETSETSATTATAAAISTAASASQSELAANRSAEDADRAEGFADAAASGVNLPIFASRALGVAGVADGAKFMVLAGNDGLTRTSTFQRVGAAALLIVDPVSGTEYDTAMLNKADKAEVQLLHAVIPRTDELIRHAVIERNVTTGELKLIYARNDAGDEISGPTESVMKTMLGADLFGLMTSGEQIVIPRTDELMASAVLFTRDGVLYVNRYETDDGRLIQPTDDPAGGTQSAAVDGHIGYGQSNVVATSGTAPVVSTVPSKHGRNNLMLSPALSGPRTFTRFIDGVTDYTVEPVEYWTGLVPSYESGTSPMQSRWPTLGDKYLDVMDRLGETRARVLCTATGLGSTSLADLSPPNTVYTTALLNNVKACADLAAMEGLRYLLRFLHWDQGEADALTPEATYRAGAISLLEAFQINAAAITGQRPRSIRMGLVQILAGGRVGPAMATLRLHEEDPRFVMFGPRYQFVYPDTVHLDATGQACVGEMIGKGCALMDASGQKFDVLRPVSFTQNGAELRIAFNNAVNGAATHPGPVGPLVIDDSFYVLTGAGGHRGMSFVDNTNQVTGIGLDGDDAVVVSLNAAPAPGAILDLGLGTSAGWRVRDSDDRDTYVATGLPIYNHSAATRYTFS